MAPDPSQGQSWCRRRLTALLVAVLSGKTWARERAFSLDLSHIQHSNLGGHGPDKGQPPTIRFKDVSTVAGTFLDLVVEQQDDYVPYDAHENGHKGNVGRVNVKAGTKTHLKLKFVQRGTDIPAPMNRLYLTVFLKDPRELVRMDYFSSGATITGFHRYCLASGSAVKANVSKDSSSIEFTAPTGKSMTPGDPKSLTKAEEKQAVTFLLHGAFEIPITVDVAGGSDGDPGLNFAFAGTNSISEQCHEWRPAALGALKKHHKDEADDGNSSAPKEYDAGCEKICKVNGVAASCKARVDWVALNQYVDEDKPCEKAYHLVVDICDVCKPCRQKAVCSAGYTIGSPMTTTTTEHHDCNKDYDTWTKSWSKPKQAWCCETKKRACPTTTTTTITRTTGDTSTATATLTFTTQPYDCSAGLAATAWSKEQRAWCCKVYIIGCTITTTTTILTTTTTATSSTSTTNTTTSSTQTSTATTTTTRTERYDCHTDFDNWREVWGDEHKQWCCEHHHRGCPPTTTEPFDCVFGFAHWEVGWTQRKRRYCCAHHNRGCPPTTTPPMCGNHPCTTSTTGTTSTADEFDCHDGYDDWVNLWTYSKKAWCCERYKRGCHFDPSALSTTTSEPFSCEEEHADGGGIFGFVGHIFNAWRQSSSIEEWPPERASFCCRKRNVGCSHTTNAAAAAGGAAASTTTELLQVDSIVYACTTDVTGWSPHEKSWCCRHKGMGCLDDVTTTPRLATTTVATTTVATTAAPSTRTTTPGYFDCTHGLEEWALGWSQDKKAYCCRTRGQGCGMPYPPSEPFDCAAGYAGWEKGWSYRKKAWCCRQYARGCHSPSQQPEPYNCEEGKLSGGSFIANWHSGQKDYCCRVHQLGCPTTTPEMFDCTAGFSSWQIGWSIQKRRWCCSRYARGCPGDAPPRQELLTADGSDELQDTDSSSAAVSRPAGLFASGKSPRAGPTYLDVRWPRSPQELLAATVAVGAAAALLTLAIRGSGDRCWSWSSFLPRQASRRLCRGISYTPVDPDTEEPLRRLVTALD